MDTTLFREQGVFSCEKELARLATQSRLTQECELPVLREILTGKCGLNILDVGSNNGYKTVRWFSDPAAAHVLGLESSPLMAREAQEAYGGERFRFCVCDVEAADFDRRLAALMAEEGIEGFDIIYLSFVLSHLRSPDVLLKRLRPVLRPGGSLITVETDDRRSALTPEDSRFREFLEMLSRDPYAGDRSLGGRLLSLLSDCGYRDAALRCDAICAGPGEAEKKEMIFDMFFSYLPEDIRLLRAENPEDAEYARWESWMHRNHSGLRSAVCAADANVSMGMAVVTCTAERS